MSDDFIDNKESDNDSDEEFVHKNYVNLIKSLITFSLNFDEKDINYSFPRLIDTNGEPLVLQPSLFPMVWPTIYFALDEESVSSVPNKLKPYLNWKLSSITANTMKSVVLKSGFRLLKDRPTKTYRTWSAIWCKHMKCSEFKAIKDYQKVNHFPGSFHFGRKDKLWQNLRAMTAKHGIQAFGVFHPQTFLLPQELHLLKKYWNNSEEELVFILKPPASARGQGISVINKFEDIPPESRLIKPNPKANLIVQKYLTNPCLLHNETKFDLRVYVLITSMSPLRVYLYDDGLVRFASDKYSSDDNDFDNQFIHLTNYSVNKKHLNYVPNDDIEGAIGNKWSLKTLWRYLENSSKEVDVQRIRSSIEDMIIKTIISCETHISKLVAQHVNNKYSCFELLGFDIMLDNTFKPWLIEVNVSPSLRSDSSLDSAVKSQLIKDMLNIIGYQIPPKFRNCETFGDFICLNRHYYSYPLTEEEMLKHYKYETCFKNNSFAETRRLTNGLTDYDIKQLIESEDELSRIGSFKRLFPSDKTRQYLKFFDRLSYSNLLLDEWEQQYCDNREKGIEKLRSLLNRKQHLFYSKTNAINRILKNHKIESSYENVLIDK